jgi:uncharacterized metal-binding protein
VSCATKALQSIGLQPEASLLVTETICYEKNGDLTDQTGLPVLIDAVLAAVDKARTAGQVEQEASPAR